MDATLLANNMQHCRAQHVASVCMEPQQCWHLLHIVWNQSNFWHNKPQHFHCSVTSVQSVVQQCCAHLHRTVFASWKCLCMHNTRMKSVPECMVTSLDDSQQCWQLLHSFTCTTEQVPTTPNVVVQSHIALTATLSAPGIFGLNAKYSCVSLV